MNEFLTRDDPHRPFGGVLRLLRRRAAGRGHEPTSPVTDLSPRAARRWLLVATLLGAALRIFRLDALPLWNDECIQLNGIQTPFAELRVRHLFTIDHMPPFSYWIQRLFWLARPTIFSIRLPGALAGVAMIPLAYVTLRRVVSRTVSVAAAMFTALLFFLVYYSQECRAYIFFGLGIWLFLGVWLRMLQVPTPPGIRPALALFGAALLCAAFHFSTAMMLVCVGLTTAIQIAADAVGPGARTQAKIGRHCVVSFLRKIVSMGLVLLAALIVTFFMMRYFMGPKTSTMITRARGEATYPEIGMIARTLMRLTFGNGWRLIPFVTLGLAGLTTPHPETRRAARLAALLFVVSVIGAAWLFPRLGFWSFRESAPRYFFWWSWCVVIVLAAGVERLAAFSRRPNAPHLALATAAATTIASLAVPFYHYYTSDSKWFNVRAFKTWVESLGAPRTVVLYNPYDMHQLQYEWPTNAVPAAPPAYEPETYESFNVRGWMLEAAERFPDILIKSSWFRPFEPELEQRLKEVFGRVVRIENNRHSQALAALGLRPLELVPSQIYFNDDAAWPAKAIKESGLLFRSDLPMTGVRRPDGGWEFWRLLYRPSVVRVFPHLQDNSNQAHALPRPHLVVARLSEVGGLRLRDTAGDTNVEVIVQPATTRLYDPESGAPHDIFLDVRTLWQVNGRIAMDIERQVIPLPAGDSRSPYEIELMPGRTPLLISLP